jgi:hypothetical protein
VLETPQKLIPVSPGFQFIIYTIIRHILPTRPEKTLATLQTQGGLQDSNISEVKPIPVLHVPPYSMRIYPLFKNAENQWDVYICELFSCFLLE